MAGEFGPSFRPGEPISHPEAKFEDNISKARDYLMRVIKVWIDNVPVPLREKYFQSEEAQKAKVEISDHIRDLAAGIVTNESAESVNATLDIIGDRLYTLWHIEANQGQYIPGEPGAWRTDAVKRVMKALMAKVGYSEDKIKSILPDREIAKNQAQPVMGEVVEDDEKVIDGRNEFNRLAHESPASSGQTEQQPENPETKASGE